VVEIGHLDGTPLGRLWVAASDQGLVAVSLWDEPDAFARSVAERTGELAVSAAGGTVVAEALHQLAEYFAGVRRAFDLPIDWRPFTPFQREALGRVLAVSFGQQLTYRDIATQLGRPGAVRAVGRANATNPIPIIIPCHRIMGADGKLHGYSAPGGLETKAWLLRHEGSWLI
jgi:methylated-DNA-[protein]-cysteine S-methyltransferase